MENKGLNVVVFVSGGLVQSVFCTKGVSVGVEIIDSDLIDPDDKEEMYKRLEKFEGSKDNFIKCY